jgi:hypothetical protein
LIIPFVIDAGLLMRLAVAVLRAPMLAAVPVEALKVVAVGAVG